MPTTPADEIPPPPKVTPPRPSRCDVQRPDDFDQFWETTLAAADAMPLQASCAPAPLRSGDSVDTFEVHYDSLGGVRVFAWYCLPKTFDSPLPALVLPPGYISDPIIPKPWAGKGYAAITPAPRGKVGSRQQFDPGYPGLLTENIVDRNTYGYRGFFVDVIRAVDFLKSQPMIDSERIGVAGSSQGGALAIVAAALRPDDISAAVSMVPYLTDYLGAIELTRTYPYHEITDYLRLYPERRPRVRETLAYYDCLNFGPLVRCPIIVSLGMQDNIVPPETCRAAFDAIASPDKRLYCYAGCGHDGGRALGFGAVQDAFLKKHLQAKA